MTSGYSLCTVDSAFQLHSCSIACNIWNTLGSHHRFDHVLLIYIHLHLSSIHIQSSVNSRTTSFTIIWPMVSVQENQLFPSPGSVRASDFDRTLCWWWGWASKHASGHIDHIPTDLYGSPRISTDLHRSPRISILEQTEHTEQMDQRLSEIIRDAQSFERWNFSQCFLQCTTPVIDTLWSLETNPKVSWFKEQLQPSKKWNMIISCCFESMGSNS